MNAPSTPRVGTGKDHQGHASELKVGRCLNCEVRPLSVCAALDDHELEALAAASRVRAFHQGETIFDEGEPLDHVFTLSDGVLRLFKLMPDGRRQITGFLFPGDFLGLAGGNVYSCTAEAVTPVTLCQFARADFQRLTRRYPGLQDRIVEKAGHELSIAREQMLLLGRKTPSEKIASFLLHLSERQSAPEACVHAGSISSNSLHLPMNREDIADFLGLTIETVSRTLTRLKTKGVIAIPRRNEITILDRDQLEVIAEEV